MLFHKLRFGHIIILAIFLVSACSRISPGDSGETDPTISPTPIPERATANPKPVCTPPLCEPDEAYYCPGECIGGCGTVCATHTPKPPSQAAINNEFSAPASVRVFPDVSHYSWELVVDGLIKPLGLTNAGDGSGRLFILEQSGVIRVIQNKDILPTPFLDIQNRVLDRNNEQGLLGLVFHPEYEKNRYFYVNYTGKGGDTVISRFNVTADLNTADPASESVLLRIPQPYSNHNGGHLLFGPDGYLYIGMGDGGSGGDPQGNAQNLNSLLGKLLRIDIDHSAPYGVPGDNPYVEGGGRPEIWASGLRNPWRFVFDRATGDLYIGDVGQNEWEEINFLESGYPGGVNFGWDFWEGTHPFEGNHPQGEVMIPPIWEYDHTQGCSIIGGIPYRGSLQNWIGIYLYADFCSGSIWGLLRDESGTWQNQILFKTESNITSFGEDEAGEIYFVDRSGSGYLLEDVP